MSEDLLIKLKELINKYAKDSELVSISDEDEHKLREEFFEIPDDYIKVLREIGYGTFGAMGFSIYANPIEPNEVFDAETANSLKNILFVGDDFTGWMFGFDTSCSPWEMRLFNHNEMMPIQDDEPKKFLEFILMEFCKVFEV